MIGWSRHSPGSPKRSTAYFPRRQAHEAGYTDRQIELAVARGDWVRCASSVLRVAGAPSSFLGAAWVALQAAGDGAMLSHRVAGQLHRLDGVPPSALFDLYIPQARRPRDVPRTRLHRVDVGAPAHIMGLPVTPVALTVVDLARELPADTGTRIVADAIRTGRVSLPALEDELNRATLRRHVARARQAVLRADPRLESVLEDELFAIVRPIDVGIVPQYEVFDHGRFVARVDLAIPELRLALEADGYDSHARRPAFERVRERSALLQLADWSILAFTATQIRKQPRWVFDVVCRRAQQRRCELGRE
jgi:very-short-patch-repair endonuclease